MAPNIKVGDCDNAIRPTTCSVDSGAPFTFSVNALGIPACGYALVKTAIEIGGKVNYTQTPQARDEVMLDRTMGRPRRGFDGPSENERVRIEELRSTTVHIR